MIKKTDRPAIDPVYQFFIWVMSISHSERHLDMMILSFQSEKLC